MLCWNPAPSPAPTCGLLPLLHVAVAFPSFLLLFLTAAAAAAPAFLVVLNGQPEKQNSAICQGCHL